MLSSLHIENYVLIDSLDVRFPEGLVIITGQTGAGKSILLGALQLVMGGKADAGCISRGADTCVVEAEFSVPDDEAVNALLEENDIERDGGCLTIRRVLYQSGRSRSFVNDSPVPSSLLSELSPRLIDIHSQHQSLLLSDSRFQLSLLDHQASCTALADECRGIWNELQAARKELSGLEESARRAEADRDYDIARLSRLEEAALQEGELEALEEEFKQLSNAEEIKENLALAQNLISPQDAQGISSALKEAGHALEKASRFVPSISELIGRLDSSRIEIDDIFDEISSADSRISLSGERLAQVEERLSMLYNLLKKFSCQNVSELIAERDRLSSVLEDSSSVDERIAALEKKVAALVGKHSAACSALHDARSEAAPAFSAEVTESLRFLELDRAEFQVSLSPCQPGPSGSDDVVFLFSSNGTSPVPVSKCASGGEISRIMLCLKAIMARFSGMPTLIFDEIDSGVSGSVADRMGRMICDMGSEMQVVAITHLPQVAAKGKAHFVVSKQFSESGEAVSGIRQVEGHERVLEVARLLSGSEITPQAIANAESLLD